jgi:hypothetical protein
MLACSFHCKLMHCTFPSFSYNAQHDGPLSQLTYEWHLLGPANMPEKAACCSHHNSCTGTV